MTDNGITKSVNAESLVNGFLRDRLWLLRITRFLYAVCFLRAKIFYLLCERSYLRISLYGFRSANSKHDTLANVDEPTHSETPDV